MLKKAGSNEFKERYFVLYKYHLYYYKSDKESKIHLHYIFLEVNYNMIVLANSKVQHIQVEGSDKKGLLLFELVSDNVKSIIGSKHDTDYKEWISCIHNQIELANKNKMTLNINKKIIHTEKLIAKKDLQNLNMCQKLEGILKIAEAREILYDFI